MKVSMKNQVVAYKRVSSGDQSLERQLHGFKFDKEFVEKVSGSISDRPELSKMLDYIREGDTVQVHSIDRLARNLKDLENIVSQVIDKGASIEFKSESLNFFGSDDPFQRLMLQMMGAFAQFERSIIRERQAQGIAIAKSKGKYKGKPKKFDKKQRAQLYEDYENIDMFSEKKIELAKKYGISESTLYRYIRQEREIRRAVYAK